MSFYGIPPSQQDRFPVLISELQAIFSSLGYFMADMLMAFGRNQGFTRDEKLVAAVQRHASGAETGWLWRLHTLTWAARNALKLPGDFVECGVFRGFMSAVVTEVIDFATCDKTFYLYDSFEGLPEKYSTQSERAHTNPVYAEAAEHGAYSYEAVTKRFHGFPNVKVLRGVVPDVLRGTAPERIAYLHIDMNAANAEIGALDMLFDRVTPGGYVIFDDFGHVIHSAQYEAETAWMSARGYAILELPTGQGLVIKR